MNNSITLDSMKTQTAQSRSLVIDHFIVEIVETLKGLSLEETYQKRY